MFLHHLCLYTCLSGLLLSSVSILDAKHHDAQHQNEKHTPSLDSFKYTAAWTVPVVTVQEEDCVLLGREAAGRDQGTYDGFGGSRDAQDTHNPVTAASREFWEEGILAVTLGMSLHDVRTYIDVDAPNTMQVLAVNDTTYSWRTVFFITRFSETSVRTLVGKFPQARASAHRSCEKEKDALALIRWSDLKTAICSTSHNSGITVDAEVTDLHGKTTHEKVTLRPTVTRNMRNYLEDKPYTQGKESKARFYTLP
jgi:hypothetical protein